MKQTIQLSDHFTYGKLIRFTLPSIGYLTYYLAYRKAKADQGVSE